MKYKLSKDRLSMFLGAYTVEVYWPHLHTRIGCEKLDANFVKFHGRTELGFTANTQILYTRPRDGWSWERALAARILGFGIGVAYKHCENPYVNGGVNYG